MFEIYRNDNGQTIWKCNSRFGLNQCMDECERKGISVSYSPINYDDPNGSYDYLKTVPNWNEQ